MIVLAAMLMMPTDLLAQREFALEPSPAVDFSRFLSTPSAAVFRDPGGPDLTIEESGPDWSRVVGIGLGVTVGASLGNALANAWFDEGTEDSRAKRRRVIAIGAALGGALGYLVVSNE